MCAVVRLRALMARQAARLITNPPIGELLGSYQEYAAKSVGKQGREFLIAALVKSYQDSLSGIY
jgi:hypothetical protein